MTGFRVLLRKELREQWETLRFAAVVGVFAIVGMGSPVLAKYTPEIIRFAAGDALAGVIPPPTISDAIDQFLKNLLQFGAFVAILVAIGVVVTEKERGIAGFILTKPAGRAAYLAAKVTALALSLGVGVAVAGAGTYAYTTYLFDLPNLGGFLAACVLVWVMLAVTTAVTFLASTVAPSPAVAAAGGFGWLILSSAAGAIPNIGADLPAALSGHARSLALGLGPGAGGKGGDGVVELVVPVVVSLAIIGGAVALAWTSFRRQEL